MNSLPLLRQVYYVGVNAAGIMVVIARFQWVGVMDYTSNGNGSASQSDTTTTADAADNGDKDASSPRMQYFIKVLLHLISL